MTGQNISTSEPAADLESTAELPVLDATAFEPTPPWIVARARAAAEARRGEQHPAKAATKLDSELAEARRGRAAAEQRAEEVARELTHVRKTARDDLQAQLARQADLERQLREAQQALQQSHPNDQILARDRRIQELEAELLRQKAEKGPPVAGTELTAARTQIEELSAALAEQRDAVSTLRADAVASTARVQELEALCAQLRAEGEDRRAALSERDALIQKLKDDRGSEGAPFGAQRLLIRTDGDTEIAHVLGRRTSIGRSSDNDVQVEVTSISRHHALVLSEPTRSVIEDLHSTNGVRVNGRRITTRQPLKDGDSIIIGKAQFRFVMRDAPEEA